MKTRLALALILLSIMGCAPTVDTENDSADSRVPLEFAQLERRESPNDYLACPADYCPKAKPDRISPVLRIPSANLRLRLDALLAKEPRTRIVSDGGAHILIEQRSAIFKFPDLIDVELIDVGMAKSTLAIYSRSKYGYYDFGANERRVDSWLGALVAPPG